jgi:hypothetical protein
VEVGECEVEGRAEDREVMSVDKRKEKREERFWILDVRSEKLVV